MWRWRLTHALAESDRTVSEDSEAFLARSTSTGAVATRTTFSATEPKARRCQPVMPCGRCRQLLWEHGGPECLVDGDGTPRPMHEILPGAFDETAMEGRTED